MELKEQFEQAAAESKALPSKPSNETLLQLYSLYKQGSIGDINTEPPYFQSETELRFRPQTEEFLL